MSEINAKLMGALVKAQAEMGRALKDSANPFFKSKYADLTSVDGAIREVAGKHGLGYVQVSHDKENEAAIETVIVHESGETFSCGIVAVPVAKHDAQGFGSAMTYARRYSLSAAFGVCPEDDDGNAATKTKQKTDVEKSKIQDATVSSKSVAQDTYEGLSDKEQKYLADASIPVKDMLSQGNISVAYEKYIGVQFDSELQEVGFRALFSKAERSELKKHNETVKMQEAIIAREAAAH